MRRMGDKTEEVYSTREVKTVEKSLVPQDEVPFGFV